MKDFIDGRTRRRFWQERRFPSAFFEEFLGFLLLVLQTAGTTQRAESLETMSFQQAEELLTWGYTELDVSKANCNIRNATFFLDEDAWEMLNLYDRSVLPFSFFPLICNFVLTLLRRKLCTLSTTNRIMRQVAMNRRYRNPPTYAPVLHLPEVQAALLEANAAYESGAVVLGTQHMSSKKYVYIDFFFWFNALQINSQCVSLCKVNFQVEERPAVCA